MLDILTVFLATYEVWLGGAAAGVQTILNMSGPENQPRPLHFDTKDRFAPLAGYYLLLSGAFQPEFQSRDGDSWVDINNP